MYDRPMRMYQKHLVKKLGLACALLLEHFGYWCNHNRMNERNFHEGAYWTYCTQQALTEEFWELSISMVRGGLKKLIDNGLVIKGNFNNTAFNRTHWYAVTELGYKVLNDADFPPGSQYVARKEENTNASEESRTSICEIHKSICENHEYIDILNNLDNKEKDISSSKEESISPKKDEFSPELPLDEIKADIEQDCKKNKRKSLSAKEREAVEKAAEMYNALCPNLPRCIRLTDARMARVRQFLSKNSFEQLEIGLRKANSSIVLQKGFKKWGGANFDWVFNDNNFVKILEGTYDNKRDTSSSLPQFGERISKTIEL